MARKQRPEISEEDDDRGFLDKVGKGDLRSLKKSEVIGATRMGTGLLGGFRGAMMPLEPVDVTLAALEGKTLGDEELRKIERRYGSARQMARQSAAFKREKFRQDNRWYSSMKEAIVSSLGSILGGLAGAFLGGIGGFAIPIPIIGNISGAAIGFFAGAIGGGMLANNIYAGYCVKQAQDPVAINNQICKLRDQGQEVPQEMIFAALAANLSGPAGKTADTKLKRLTGTVYFSEALQDEGNVRKLSAMMSDPVLRSAIRAQTQMFRDAADPMKSVVEQYAQLINSGQMDPRNLLIPGGGMLSAAAPLANNASYAPEVPVTPGVERPGRDRLL